MSAPQVFNVTSSAVSGIVSRIKNLRGKWDTQVLLSLKVDLLTIDGPASIEVPPFYSYRFFVQHETFVTNTLNREIQHRYHGFAKIIKASLSVSPVIDKCGFCNAPCSDWWEHAKTCGGSRCCQCLELSCDGVSCCRASYTCEVCRCTFTSHIDRKNHKCDVEVTQTALEGRFLVYQLKVQEDTANYEGVLLNNLARINNCLDLYRERHFKTLKFNLTCRVEMSKLIHGEEKSAYFATTMTHVLLATDTTASVRMHVEQLIEKISKYIRDGSGWVVNGVTGIDIMIAKYNPTGAAKFIPLPDELKGKRSIINIQNDDDHCFWYCLLAKRYPAASNKHRVSHYTPYFDRLDRTGVESPVLPEKVGRVETLNKISINIYTYEKGVGILPIRISESGHSEEVDLLLLQDGELQHYALITNRSGFFRDIGPTTSEHHKMFCPRCIQGFRLKRSFENHVEICKYFKSQRTNMPQKGKTVMKFEDLSKTIPAPCWVIADFECIKTVKTGDSGKTKTIGQLKPSGFSWKLCSDYEEYDLPPRVYVGP